MAGFAFMVVNRAHAVQGLAVAALIGITGSAIYLIRAKLLGAWPFVRTESLLHPPFNK